MDKTNEIRLDEEPDKPVSKSDTSKPVTETKDKIDNSVKQKTKAEEVKEVKHQPQIPIVNKHKKETGEDHKIEDKSKIMSL